MVTYTTWGVAVALALRGDTVVEVVGEGERGGRPQLDLARTALVVIHIGERFRVRIGDGGDLP
jgi:hypothetical protein